MPLKIQLKPDAVPKMSYPYRVPLQFRMKIQKEIDEYLAEGILRESESQWGSPCIVVEKGVKKSQKHLPQPENRGLRLVIDYRYLNAQSIFSKIDMPRFDDIFDTIAAQKPKYFTLCDLKSAYTQLKLDEDSEHLTNFLFNGSSYCYRRLPMGLSSSPAAFQRLINHVVMPIRNTKVICYLDDVLILGKNEQDHLQNIHETLQLFEKSGLKFHPQKCDFMMKEVTFLGHKFSSEGISPSESHVEALKDYPVPKNIKELRTFLGLVTFFREYIPDRARLTGDMLH